VAFAILEERKEKTMKGLAITFIVLIAVFYAVPQDWSSPEDFGALGLTGGQVGIELNVHSI
jgi:hypothetical protein